MIRSYGGKYLFAKFLIDWIRLFDLFLFILATTDH